MRQPDPSLPEPLARVLDDVAADGVHIAHVLASEDGAVPAYAFTVGLWHTFERPEVIVFGLDEEVAEQLLEALADEASDGASFAPGSRSEGLLHGYPVRFLDVPKERRGEHVALADWAHEGADFPLVQVVYPDKQGRWPWDPEAREGFRRHQPVIGVREPSA
ncbi:MAG: DUF4262 domain-containing protein [Planctomycetota bacterium]